MRTTHTYVLLGISAAAYLEIAKKLRDADYKHCFDTDKPGCHIDMHGLAVQPDTPADMAEVADPAPPHRYELSIKLGANSAERICSMLREIASCQAGNAPKDQLLVGDGYYSVSRQFDPTITPESHKAALSEWFDRQHKPEGSQ